DVPDGLCDEQAICEIEQGEYDPDPPPTADLEPTVFDPQEQLKPSQEPTTNTEQYPDEPPCDTGSPCALDRQHNWCHYEVTEDLNDRTPKNPRKVLKSGGSSPISFSVDPDLNLTFKMTPGPLGIAMPDLAGVAAFKATAEVNALGLKNRVLDLIDLSAQIHGGVNPDLCGVNTDGTRAIVFGIDLLPEDFEGVQEPSATDAAECRKALGHFQEAVDRAKKAFSDARELLEQYKAVDSGHNLQKLCEQYVKSPPLGFPAPTVPCADETPEQTINRFIDFYVKTTDDVRRIVRDEIAGKLDDWFALDATFAIGDGLKQVEEFTLLNQTFPVGPIPANLEVLLVVGYGLGVSGTATFQAGALLKDLVALTPGNDLTMGPPFVSVGTNGTPYVDAGISLFVGVGFDAGFASAKAGVSGSISLGHVSVPAHATAGITIGTSDDDRDLPPYMTEALVDPDVPLLPQKRYHYGLVYDIGAALQLRDVLSGEIGVKVKVKFFFFSKTWKKRIIKFNGLCPAGHPQSWCDVPIFDAEGGVAEGDWDWGTVQMPMPFLALRRIGAPKATGLPTVPFATSDVAELFYDSLCACIPTWETMTTAQKAEVNDCFRLEDCCDQGGSQTCFFDPDDSRKKCTDCRAQGESCSNDSECNCPALTAGGRPANNCLFRNTPDGVRGTCQRLGDCNGPCNDDTDCVPNQTCSEFSDGTTSCEPATSCIQ
ncbi:MAG: hypothetical protein FJ104_03650, partial [Deltaproteobacteria bacterium]|nr:hypothetical protein [Deltaproteobacteria bacterium]